MGDPIPCESCGKPSDRLFRRTACDPRHEGDPIAKFGTWFPGFCHGDARSRFIDQLIDAGNYVEMTRDEYEVARVLHA